MSDTTRCQGHCSGCYGTRTASHVLDVVLSLPSDVTLKTLQIHRTAGQAMSVKSGSLNSVTAPEMFDSKFLMIFFTPEVQLRVGYYYNSTII